MNDLNALDALAIVRYCAEEVKRQQRGPLQVAGMVEAWFDACDRKFRGEDLSLYAIRAWGQMIEPEKNDGEFRRIPIFIVGPGMMQEKTKPDRVELSMETWLEAVREDNFESPDHAYKAFEDVHPFVDGNGRAGKIIFNWLSDSFLEPKWPFNWWGIANP